MKTQTYGSYPLWLRDRAVALPPPLLSAAAQAYRDDTPNGNDADAGDSEFAADGRYTWVKGLVDGGYVYGVTEGDGYYHYEVRYDAGPGDLAWMEERDRNYLTRILREGKLRELEPAVWYWWNEEGGPAINIAEWWSQKLKLPDLDDRLKRTEAAAAELKRTGEEATWERAAHEKAEREAREREERERTEAERRRFEQ